MFEKWATTLDLGAFSEKEKIKLRGDSPDKRKFSDMQKKSREKAKRNTCFYCGREVDSFCNSHSIPAFCLKNISSDGEVLTLNALVDNPLLEDKKGVKKAGTFQLICRECDSKIFSDYENPDNYGSMPTDKMIAQMALKNYMKVISKRLLENEIFRMIQSEAGELSTQKINVNNMDLKEYIDGYEHAKKALAKGGKPDFYVCFYERLPYVVPIAFQSPVALVFDFEGNMINNIYNPSSKYEVKNVNICILPMKNDSIILMFVNFGDKRYRRFFQQFRKLSLDEKLAALTFIMFAYSEDMYFSKTIKSDVEASQNLCEIGRSTQDIISSTLFLDPIESLKKTYDLNNRHQIPNLLSENYKLR